ncbi:MAG: GNAT family N-acetyltransferase [bacterium]|nr:GNAT family N-acetyltransferase [bacterium]
MSDPRIHDFEERDYEAFADLHNIVFADYPETAAERKRHDDLKDPKHFWRRWVWEEEGRILGTGFYGQDSWHYHPRKYFVEAVVAPEARGRGIGAALYETVTAALAELKPIGYFCLTNEEWQASRRFAAKRGFGDGMRMQESRFAIQSFEPGDYSSDLEHAGEQGIVMRSWAEIDGNEAEERKFHALSQQLLADMPSTEPFDPSPFELWRKRALESPRFLPELNLLAIEGEEFVGMSNFWGSQVPGQIGTGLTGVLASHRRRGIATALKIRALSAARAAGFRSTITWNAAENAGMLGINNRLGFQPGPAWIEMEKALCAESEVKEARGA